MQASQPGIDAAAPLICGALKRIGTQLARIEMALAGALVAAIFLLLLGNVVTRSLGVPMIWIDELAIYLMIGSGLLGASVAIARREHIAVTLLPDMFDGRTGLLFAIAIDAALLVFLIAFAVLLWFWFDPIGLWRAGSAEALASQSFNFLYQEPTTTLGLRKVWFWLILPVFAGAALFHAGVNLIGSLAQLKIREIA